MLASRHALRGRAGVCLLLCAALACAVSLPAPRAASAQHPAHAAFVDTGTLTLAVGSTPSDLDPASDEYNSSDIIQRALGEALVAFDGSHIDRFVPLLATSWQVNAAHSVWTFHLRHGVRFHTGRCCMTADDVKYSIGRTVLANLAGAYMFGRFLPHPQTQIQVLDPYTVRFTLGRPQYLFLNAVASEFNGLILDSQALRAHATKSDPWAHTWITDHDAGTGPYVLTSWTHGQQVVLTRFPDYWGGWSGRHFSKIVENTVPEAATRRELLEGGRADLTYSLTPLDYQALSKNPAVVVHATPGTAIDYLIMTEYGPLASPFARQALSYAFDYTAYLNAAFHGYARRAYGCLASSLLGYDPRMFHYQTDLAKARALLRQAGVKPGTTLTLSYDESSPEPHIAGLILQAQLAQLGLTLKLQGLDDATYLGIFFSNKPASERAALQSNGWYPDYNDPWDECSPLLGSAATGGNGANEGFYHNARIDALLAQMKYASPEVLVRDAHLMQDIDSRVDPSAIWLDEPDVITVLRRDVQGYVYNPLEVNTYNFYALHR